MFPFQSGELSFQFSNALENNNNNNNISTNNNIIITNTNTNFLFEQHSNIISTSNATLAATNTNDFVHQPQYGVDSKFKSPKTRKTRSGKSIQDKNNNEEINGNGSVANKKVIHREVERQRRQEMSNLYSSLRSLLPMEYVKGKRSVSDHITEATRYIKDLEKNVKELGEKRDSLKDSFSSLENRVITTRRENLGCSSSSSTTSTISRSCSTSSNTTATRDYIVNIHKFSKTLQIEITAGVEDDDPCPISKTLKVLAQEGLDVVSCVSNKVNQRWIYVLYCEVNDETSVDSCQLREKLMSVVVSASDV